MIDERVREMTAEERAWLQQPVRPLPVVRGRFGSFEESWELVAVCLLAAAIAGWRLGPTHPVCLVFVAAGALLAAFGAVKSSRRRKARDDYRRRYDEEMARTRARLLEDGRVRVKRVRAVAVVEIEALEDEGTGYVFDVGDGRVLFLKGEDYAASEPWPNTDFEIVRTADGSMLLDVRCHGTALPPVRVVSRGEVDPATGWEAREEVLELGLEEAVGTVLRAR
ncbi:MAG TPA: hypothetical protein VGF28_03035 [Thermoanaerobaculia bacterium]